MSDDQADAQRGAEGRERVADGVDGAGHRCLLVVVIGVGGRRNRVMSDDVKTGVSVHADRGVDVDGRQEREDVGLEGGDEGLEDDEGDPRGQGDRAQRLERGRGVDEQGVGGHEAQGQQQVAGDHIRHESDRQRQGPQDEVGSLDRKSVV